MESLTLPGAGFEHRAFTANHAGGDLLVVFIDGDGTPWTFHGSRVASDPTPRAPLALKLAAETPYPVLYLGRPCYFKVQGEPPCFASYWTDERYSQAVVGSMASATATYAADHGFKRILMVGYSGGGTLAMLMTPHVTMTVGVITIAANLDPDTWTRLHRYLPLTGSLNPSTQPALPKGVQEWHLIGGRDTRVPYEAAQRYLQRVPPDRVRRYAGFDHVCCWEAAWPPLLREVRAVLDVSE